MEATALDSVRGFVARSACATFNAGVAGARDVLFMRGGPPADPKRIVVHHVGNVGDVVVLIPSLIALRERYPNARLTYVTSAGKSGIGAAQLLQGARFLDDLIRYDLQDTRSTGGILKVLAIFRDLHPDLLIMLPPTRVPAERVIRNLAFAKATGANFVIGLEASSLHFWMRSQAKSHGLYEHEVDRNLRLLSAANVHPRQVRFEFGAVKSEELERIDRLLADVGPFAAICPGGKQVGHLWPLERFEETAERLRKDTNLRVITIGAPGEADSCEQVARASSDGINTAGQFSLLGTTEILRRAKLLVTNDTGPMHLAAAVGTPTVAIFASWDFPGKWYPYGEGHEVLRARLVCDECFFAEKRTDHCVREISTDQVWQACNRVLQRLKGRSGTNDALEGQAASGV